MKLRVRNELGLGICGGCRHGQVMRDDRGNTTTYCDNLMHTMRIRRPVMQCTDFSDRTQDSEYEMRQVAWTLRTDKRGKLGFQPPVKKDEP